MNSLKRLVSLSPLFLAGLTLAHCAGSKNKGDNGTFSGDSNATGSTGTTTGAASGTDTKTDTAGADGLKIYDPKGGDTTHYKLRGKSWTGDATAKEPDAWTDQPVRDDVILGRYTGDGAPGKARLESKTGTTVLQYDIETNAVACGDPCTTEKIDNKDVGTLFPASSGVKRTCRYTNDTVDASGAAAVMVSKVVSETYSNEKALRDGRAVLTTSTNCLLVVPKTVVNAALDPAKVDPCAPPTGSSATFSKTEETLDHQEDGSGSPDLTQWNKGAFTVAGDVKDGSSANANLVNGVVTAVESQQYNATTMKIEKVTLSTLSITLGKVICESNKQRTVTLVLGQLPAKDGKVTTTAYAASVLADTALFSAKDAGSCEVTYASKDKFVNGTATCSKAFQPINDTTKSATLSAISFSFGIPENYAASVDDTSTTATSTTATTTATAVTTSTGTSTTSTGTTTGTSVQTDPIIVVTMDPPDTTAADRYAAAQVNFINWLYVNSLLRAPDAVGKAAWLQKLNTCGAYATSLGIAYSTEGLGVDRLFFSRAYFGRDLTDDYWVKAFNNPNFNWRANVTTMLASPEFFVRAGNTNGNLIRTLYVRVLGRNALDSEIAYWVRVANANRLEAVRGIVFAPEATTHLVSMLYAELLQRPASAAEAAAWANVLATQSYPTVRARIQSSPEYIQKGFPNVPNLGNFLKNTCL